MPHGGSLLFEDTPHSVDIYLPTDPTTDSGGGVVLNWAATASQAACPCIINTTGSRVEEMQGQQQTIVSNMIGIWSDSLTVVLVRGTKFIAMDTGRTFILRGLRSPNRSFGEVGDPQAMPALTYCECDEIL